MALLGALAFVVALLISVMLHEGGHFFTARRYGMKATQFFVGFGPTLWSTRRGETEYGVKAIPAGGFVKIVGMTSLEPIDPADESRAFYRQPARRRAVVLAAGSTMHFVLAAVLILGSAMVIGQPAETSPALGPISSCVPLTAPVPAQPGAVQGDGCDTAGAVPAPAAAAGLRQGDVVVAVAGKEVRSSGDFVTAVRASPGRPVALTVVRDDQRQEITLTPATVQRPVRAPGTGTETVGAVGVRIVPKIGTERLGPVAALRYSGETAVTTVQQIGVTLTQKLGTLTRLYSPDRDPQGFIGLIGAGRISGEVLASEETVSVKALQFILLMAGLNVFVGVFNLLPLLPLDGGHLAVLGFEQLRDRLRRMRGYVGELQRVDLTKLLPLTYGVVVVFAALTVLIAGADIVNPITLN